MNSLAESLSAVWESVGPPLAIGLIVIVSLRLAYILRRRAIRQRRDALRFGQRRARRTS